tara:strand:- start:277 stop:1176 length:900 start_codon:yes stop_codon:yes gene_type:complete
MIIVPEQSERLLCEALQAISTSHEKFRALHIPYHERFISNTEGAELHEQKLIKELNNLLEDKDVRAYLCHDGDLVLLGQGLSIMDYKTIALSLCEHYALPHDFTQLYEKGINWYQFSVLCNDKYEAIEKLEKERKLAALQEKKRRMREAALNLRFSEDILASIASRRHKHEQISIVFAEDDPFSRKLVKTSLGRNFQVYAEENGRHAIEAYVHKAPDVLFLDIDLPDITGHEVLQKIMQYDPNAYVIMLSGNGDRDNVMKAIQLGAKGFVAKPFNKEKLMQYVEMAPTYHKRSSTPCES